MRYKPRKQNALNHQSQICSIEGLKSGSAYTWIVKSKGGSILKVAQHRQPSPIKNGSVFNKNKY